MIAEPSSTRREGLPALLCGLAAAAVYLPALTAGFTSDDFLIVSRLQEMRGLERALDYFTVAFYDYYRPVAFVSHAIDWTMWQGRAGGFHLTNVVLHAMNTVLVYGLARRMLRMPGAAVAALLFGLHPASHEAVYWIAARFDLLATFFGLLALWCYAREERWAVPAGAAAFTLALLSKESAVSIPLMAASYDVFVRRLDAGRTAKRLAPLLLVLGAYALLRSQAAGLDAAGGANRLAKLVMFGVGVAAVLYLAFKGRGAGSGGRGATGRIPWTTATGAAAAAGLILGAGAVLTPASGWISEKLAFVGYLAFHLVTPIVAPAPPPYFLDPGTPVYWAAGLAACVAIVWLALAAAPFIARSPAAQTAIAFTVAALIPVSTLTGGARYFYLATVGASLLAGLAVSNVRLSWSVAVRVALAIWLLVSGAQILTIGRAWRWASDMSAGAAVAVAPQMAPCGSRDVVLLTAPVGIAGVFSNLNDEAFTTQLSCGPAAFRALARVVREDVRVEVSVAADAITWRIPDYRGNVVVSRDLRSFDRPLRTSRTIALDTPLGRLESHPEGAAQVFTLAPNAAAKRAVLAYYSEGQVRLLPRTIE